MLCNTSLAGLHRSMIYTLVLLINQRGEDEVEGEIGTKGVGVAVIENKNVLPSLGTPVLCNWKV